VIPLELPSYQRKENFGADETFFQIVRALAKTMDRTTRVTCNLIGPTALGFRHRDDIEELTGLLSDLGVDVNVCAPMNATPTDIARMGAALFNVLMYPETAETAARGWKRTSISLTPRSSRSARVRPVISFSEVAAITGLPWSRRHQPSASAVVCRVGRFHLSDGQTCFHLWRRHARQSRRTDCP
jgi:light-independent protochlorophyllide reductase subunit B